MCDNQGMKKTSIYAGYRYPSQIISHTVWLYYRFTLSFRDMLKNCWQRGEILSVTKLSEIGVINSDKGTAIQIKLGDICPDNSHCITYISSNYSKFSSKGMHSLSVTKKNQITILFWPLPLIVKKQRMA